MPFARVAVPVPLGRAFSYIVPPDLDPPVRVGSRVLVEFGRRKVLAVVLELSEDAPDVPLDKLKPIRAVLEPEPVLPEELVGFLRALARYYLAPVGEVMRLALLAVERSTRARLGDEQLKMTTVGRLVQIARAVESPAQQAPVVRGQAQSILARLRERGPVPVAELGAEFKSARAAIKRLVEAGLVEVEKQQMLSADPFFAAPVVPESAPALNPAQQTAVDALCQELEVSEPGHFLLHGVTGSGKTEVYLQAVRRVLEQGRGAIVLVPEIALTPQLVARFRGRIGDRIAVLHSGLTDSERHEMWTKLRSGEVQVAIGARSAIFAPVRRLALICVDEEHDGSFKQEEGVRYNARDMAMLRAHRANAVCVLGSATPSTSSFALVESGRLRRLRLPDRAFAGARLPEVSVIDLRRTGPGPSGHRLLSLRLHRALEETLQARGQAILFLNRRGFAPSLRCEGCGEVVQCPNCAIALTLHRSRGGQLRCHYCDYEAPPPSLCPHCKGDRLMDEGAGTERIEVALAETFPQARVARLDRDVAAGAKSEKILARMRAEEIDILVGTQMVTKGHDLPGVVLVGVLNADAALSMPDFRAAERTFHLLVQVAGRAGRGEQRGRVLIQSYQPEHSAIVLAARHDVDGFVERELADRRELGYPPYSHLALVRVDAVEERVARAACDALAQVARGAKSPSVEILGPAIAPLARLRGRYRFRFLVRSRERQALRQTLIAVARQGVDRRVKLVIDVDPMSML